MDAKVLYWTAALINMSAVLALVESGIRQAKAGEMESHRKRMGMAALLVVAFLVSYGFKLSFLGREDFSSWSRISVWVLRIHECCVLVMVLAGGFALRWGGRLKTTRRFTRTAGDPEADLALVRRHHQAGAVAFWGAALGFLTACVVLAGMYMRNPA